MCHVPFKEKEYFDKYIKLSMHKIIWRGSPRKTLQVLAVHRSDSWSDLNEDFVVQLEETQKEKEY